MISLLSEFTPSKSENSQKKNNQTYNSWQSV